ncbi:Hemicentin-1 [Desmophyllum pertusum]|uniref:Hemicentin-1 n=1 Tax=Desmophyllum pertusum TaxID=174260 RepID=A0A9X0CNS1_9CNID|nr:Hemicentin-1 [Desmophyllum pertusum]
MPLTWNTIECAVDGLWTEWRDWEPCSVSCGGGIQTSRRSCTNPEPAFGGADCEGDSVRSQSCNKKGCPVDANWSKWSSFTPCTLSCGGGTHKRSRTCTNPPPKFDGEDCIGESDEVQPCNILPCPVNGGWSPFGRWGSCSLTCGGGIQDRLRACNNPLPAFGGTPCDGPDVESRFCHLFPCPVDGKWTRWSDWDACPVKCGGATQARLRSCTNPSPAFGGAKCIGERQQVQACNAHPCGVDGNWARWKSWGRCSKSCGGGKRAEHEPAPTPHLLTVAEIVQENKMKLSLAIINHVQWTATGPRGKTGADVHVHVVEEHSLDLVLAPAPLRRIVDRGALGRAKKHNRAIRMSRVQVTEKKK